MGRFSNCGNPHKIREQIYEFTVTMAPSKNEEFTKLESGVAFGVAINGVPFEPLAAGCYQGDRYSKWRYEALSGAVPLGPRRKLRWDVYCRL